MSRRFGLALENARWWNAKFQKEREERAEARKNHPSSPSFIPKG